MKTIKKKSEALGEFISNAIKEVDENKNMIDCILIPIFNDGSSEMYHTRLKNSEIIYALRSQEHIFLDEMGE